MNNIKTVIITFDKGPAASIDLGDSIQINGGMLAVDGVLTEAYDFLPNYSSLNGALFESSVILTSWKHRFQLFGDSHVGFVHDDIAKTPYFEEALEIINNGPSECSAYGITVPLGVHPSSVDITDDPYFHCENDAWRYISFDATVDIWDMVRKYDPEAYAVAEDVNPPMAYGHQFVCTNDVFHKLGLDLKKILSRISLEDVGLWTPHVFERIIAIRLYMHATASFRLLNMYDHTLSSGKGRNKLYGVREYKFISC